jgi:hypothetical protein
MEQALPLPFSSRSVPHGAKTGNMRRTNVDLDLDVVLDLNLDAGRGFEADLLAPPRFIACTGTPRAAAGPG